MLETSLVNFGKIPHRILGISLEELKILIGILNILSKLWELLQLLIKSSANPQRISNESQESFKNWLRSNKGFQKNTRKKAYEDHENNHRKRFIRSPTRFCLSKVCYCSVSYDHSLTLVLYNIICLLIFFTKYLSNN